MLYLLFPEEMTNDKKICGYCQTQIKNAGETILCPGCKTPYHIDCWNENKGCAVYGCNETAIHEAEHSIGDLFVNIEFLINERRFAEAITESKRILETDRDNIKAKRYYNKAVSLINTKTKLLEEADIAFDHGDYRGAEVYYSNAMQFLDDEERKLNEARIAVVRQKVPQAMKRKRMGNIIAGTIAILILAVIAYLGYYFIVLKEDREYAEIEREDNTEDVKLMEMQLSQYHRFAIKYKDGRNFDRAMDKISYFAGILADSLAISDWREAMRYMKRIDRDRSTKTYSDVYGKIFSMATAEFNESVSNGRKLNSMKKYIEARKMMEQALSIAREFPESEIAEEREKLNSNISILSQKISTSLKYDNIQSEILEKTKELEKYGLSAPKTSGNVIINATIEERLNNSTFLARSDENGSLLAVRGEGYGFRVGEYASFEATRSGSLDIETRDGYDLTVPLYIPVKLDIGLTDISPDRYARESIMQRLEYLKGQRTKLDSILSIKLL